MLQSKIGSRTFLFPFKRIRIARESLLHKKPEWKTKVLGNLLALIDIVSPTLRNFIGSPLADMANEDDCQAASVKFIRVIEKFALGHGHNVSLQFPWSGPPSVIEKSTGKWRKVWNNHCMWPTYHANRMSCRWRRSDTNDPTQKTLKCSPRSWQSSSF